MRCSAAHRIFSFTMEMKLLSDLFLWLRSLLLNLFDPEETWLQASFFPDTENLCTAGGTTCGQQNKIHFTGVHSSSPACQRGTRGIWFWPLTPVSCAHQHAYPSGIWGGEWCTSFTSRLGMERGGVLLSLCLTQHAVSSVSLVLTVTALQIQKVTMHSEPRLLSQNSLGMYAFCGLCNILNI